MKPNKHKNYTPTARTHYMRPFYGRYMYLVIATFSIFFLQTFFHSAYACSYESDRKVLIEGVRKRAEMKKTINAIRKKSDTIFVGRVAEVKDNSVVFESVENINGRANITEPYTWVENPALIEISCSGGLVNTEHVNIEYTNGFDYYLVYSKRRKIIRAVRVEYDASAPSSHEEIEWIR